MDEEVKTSSCTVLNLGKDTVLVFSDGSKVTKTWESEPTQEQLDEFVDQELTKKL